MNREDKRHNERLSKSRDLVFNAMLVAYGSYIEQEAKKGDTWVEQTYGQLYSHLKHEIEEIKRSNTKTFQIHNLIDACNLSAIMLAKLLFDGEDKK